MGTFTNRGSGFSPGGTSDNSPAIHCRERIEHRMPCPVGTTENSPAIHCRAEFETLQTLTEDIMSDTRSSYGNHVLLPAVCPNISVCGGESE